MYAYLVKFGNKSLEAKNNSNEIILIGFYLRVKGNVQKGGRSHLTISPYLYLIIII